MNGKLLLKIFIPLACLGAVCAIAGGVLGWVVFPNEVEKQIKENVELVEGTEQFDRFQKLPIPYSFRVYFFTVKNADEIMKGAKPILEEKGPYVYKEEREKVNIKYDKETDTFSYNEVQKYTFDAKASRNLSDEDEVLIFNTPLNGIFQAAERDFKGLIRIINTFWPRIMQHTNFFEKKKVKDILLEGVEFCTDPSAKIVCNKLRVEAKKIKNMEVRENSVSFTLFAHKQNKDDGRYTVKAGRKDIQELGLIQEWNNMTELEGIWKPGSCTKIEGRDSQIFPPFIEKNDEFAIYSTDVCRVLHMKFEKEVEFRDVEGYRFKLRKTDLTEPEHCFCINESKMNISDPDPCLKPGALDLYSCYNAPVVLTLPHMLYADKVYQDSVIGLNPDEKKHAIMADLEPNTGAPMRGMKRVQFNMFFRPVEGIDVLQNVAPSLFPIVWVDEFFELDDDLYDTLMDSYFNIMEILDGVHWGLFIGGLVICVASLVVITAVVVKMKKSGTTVF